MPHKKTKSKTKNFLRKTHLKQKSRPKILRKRTITKSKLKSKPRTKTLRKYIEPKSKSKTKTLFGSNDIYQPIRSFAIYQGLNVDKISNIVDFDFLDAVILEAINSRTSRNGDDYHGYDNYVDVMTDRLEQIEDKLDILFVYKAKIYFFEIKPKNFKNFESKIDDICFKYLGLLRDLKKPHKKSLMAKWFLKTLDVMVFLMKYDMDVLRDLDDFIITFQNKTLEKFDNILLDKIEQFSIGLFELKENTKKDTIKNLKDFYESSN